VDDLVFVEGFNGGTKSAEGSAKLAAAHISGSFTSVTVTVYPSSNGSGSVNLSVSFPAATAFTAPDTEITAAEITLYASLADYQAGTVSQFSRYVLNSTYGSGTTFSSGPSIPLNYTSLSSGNYVVKIEFFRGKFIRIKTLVQTLLVRDGLTTNKWDGGGSALDLTAVSNFASSNANLAASAGIAISTASLTYSPATYNYSVLKAYASESPTVTINARAGQTVTAAWNGANVPLTKTSSSYTGSLSSLNKAANALAISVTAPDGVTQQTYAVSYTYRHGTIWYVSASGNDSDGLSLATAFNTVGKALDAIKTAYTGTWAGKTDIPKLPIPVLIQISGNINTEGASYSDGYSLIKITDTALYAALPPVMLAGDGGGDDKITGGNSKRVLYIEKAHVILGDNLTITGGEAPPSGPNYDGGGVYVTGSTDSVGSFTMNGGTISGNTASNGGGGGVHVSGSASNFTMNGGTISGNTGGAGGSGGAGVNVSSGSFTMNGGTISSNSAPYSVATGGGVNVSGTTGTFTMIGGTISENTVGYAGGGVRLSNGSSFTMIGGAISGNSANTGGGVNASGASFTMSGGTVSGNTATNNGDGVYFNGSSNFTMSGSALVDSGNKVYLNSGKVITLSGALTQNLAANIQDSGFVPGTTELLTGDLTAGSPQNYTRFLVDGAEGKIGSDGKYQP
jgi:parallel beta-helix repeat protein